MICFFIPYRHTLTLGAPRFSLGCRLFLSFPVTVFIRRHLIFSSNQAWVQLKTHWFALFSILLIQARLCCNNTPSLSRVVQWAVDLSYLDNHVTNMRTESSTLRILLMGPGGQKSRLYVTYNYRHHDWNNAQCHGGVFLPSKVVYVEHLGNKTQRLWHRD